AAGDMVGLTLAVVIFVITTVFAGNVFIFLLIFLCFYSISIFVLKDKEWKLILFDPVFECYGNFIFPYLLITRGAGINTCFLDFFLGHFFNRKLALNNGFFADPDLG